MQSKSESASQIEANPYKILSSAALSEPWWRHTNYNYISSNVIAENSSYPSLREQSKDDQSQSDDGVDEEDDDAIKESHISASPHSDENYGPDHRNFQHQTSAIHSRSNESLTQPQQLELVGHSIPCASNPYFDPYYGGIMATYGPQSLVPPHLLDTNNARMPLPLEMTQEPVYVNAKQYHGILRRRQSRAKAELERKLIKVRKPYLHESRHQHAMKRARASGGRFAKKSDSNALKSTAKETGRASGSAISSGSEPLHCETAETNNGHQEAKGLEVHETCEVRRYDNDQYQNRSRFQASTYGANSANGAEGGSIGQQWGSHSSNKASQRCHNVSVSTDSWSTVCHLSKKA
ncbi:Nuclear transcription factor Y subunit A-1 like [Actinidia chinensis var. chinensis]|uniref:Nuclear transcription factor Y subunit n=1 Tax=Actinidia chinensis var. chinensis TaxID=1590841 RepID=A0A2R6PFN5_ACTCC|nr:Nuclear transcription factor Y subunit A-1 like [Actinidia chinensis var. chinensis]